MHRKAFYIIIIIIIIIISQFRILLRAVKPAC